MPSERLCCDNSSRIRRRVQASRPRVVRVLLPTLLKAAGNSLSDFASFTSLLFFFSSAILLTQKLWTTPTLLPTTPATSLLLPTRHHSIRQRLCQCIILLLL